MSIVNWSVIAGFSASAGWLLFWLSKALQALSAFQASADQKAKSRTADIL
jgi:hypothetical protein